MVRFLTPRELVEIAEFWSRSDSLDACRLQPIITNSTVLLENPSRLTLLLLKFQVAKQTAASI
jgi:hypothetical protein